MHGVSVPGSRPKPPPPPRVPGGFGLRGRVPEPPRPSSGVGKWSGVISVLTVAAAFLLLSMLASLVARQVPADPRPDGARALPAGDLPEPPPGGWGSPFDPDRVPAGTPEPDARPTSAAEPFAIVPPADPQLAEPSSAPAVDLRPLPVERIASPVAPALDAPPVGP